MEEVLVNEDAEVDSVLVVNTACEETGPTIG